jgi:hypothetical protein
VLRFVGGLQKINQELDHNEIIGRHGFDQIDPAIANVFDLLGMRCWMAMLLSVRVTS